MPLRDIFITLVIFGLIPAIAVNPHLGIYAWAWLSYMNPHRLSWGFAYFFPFAQIIAITTIAAVVLQWNKFHFPKSFLSYLMVFFLFWMGVTTIAAYNPSGAMTKYQDLIKIMLMVFLTMMLINDEKKLHMLVMVTALSLGFYGIKGGLFTIATGGLYRVHGPAYTFFQDNNDLGLALIITLPLFRYLQLSAKKKYESYFYLACMGLIAIGIVGTYSRGAFLGGIAMGLFLFRRSRKKFFLFGVLAALLYTIGEIMPQQWFERMGTIPTTQQTEGAATTEEQASVSGRINSWWFAWYLANDNPLTGAGFGAFNADLYLRYAPIPNYVLDAHSIYFEVLAEHGFVGLFTFILLFFSGFTNAGWIVKRTRRIPSLIWAGDLAGMLQTCLIGYGVGGAFLGFAYFDLPYQYLAMVVLLRKLVEKRIAEGVDEKAKVEILLERKFTPPPSHFPT